MSLRAGIRLSALVNDTNFAAGYLEPKSCTMTTWLDEGIGPYRSTATISQFFDGTLFCCIGSLVFLSTNALQSLHEFTKSIMEEKLCSITEEKLCSKASFHAANTRVTSFMC